MTPSPSTIPESAGIRDSIRLRNAIIGTLARINTYSAEVLASVLCDSVGVSGGHGSVLRLTKDASTLQMQVASLYAAVKSEEAQENGRG